MSATVSKEKEGLIVINVDGILTFNELKEIEEKERQVIDRDKGAAILILAEKFAGWGKEGDWGDLTFMYEYDPYIKKIAIVADEKWRDEMLMFTGAGHRQASIEFFFPDEVEEARDWLKDKNE
jgi:hypothetical protein